MKKSVFKQKMLVHPCPIFLKNLQYSLKGIELYQCLKKLQTFDEFNPIEAQS
jgi:hypothetical protein